MKKLCIADTCSLIYLSNTEARIGNKLVYSWLWDEFHVRYSKTVLEEFSRHTKKKTGKHKYDTYVWKGNFKYLEKKLFGNVLTRTVEHGTCSHCGRIITRAQSFEANLDDSKDRGERHNCCVAVNALQDHSQVIFLTDDYRATRDYVDQLFTTIPLGVVWSSLDFVIYLFSKYKGRISLDETLAALRDVNTQDGQLVAQKSANRLTKYIEKAQKIQRLLS